MVAITTVMVTALLAAEDGGGPGISIDPSASGGPGEASLNTLMNYASWLGFRFLALAFLVSVAAAGFGRMSGHMATENFGKKGALVALAAIVVLAAAEPLVNFAGRVGGQAGGTGG